MDVHELFIPLKNGIFIGIDPCFQLFSHVFTAFHPSRCAWQGLLIALRCCNVDGCAAIIVASGDHLYNEGCRWIHNESMIHIHIQYVYTYIYICVYTV